MPAAPGEEFTPEFAELLILQSAEPAERIGTTPPSYPVLGTPCGDHTGYRNIAYLDIGGSVLAIAVLLVLGRPRSSTALADRPSEVVA